MNMDAPALAAFRQRNAERDGLHLFTVRAYLTQASLCSWSGFVRFTMRLLATNAEDAGQLAYSRLQAWNEREQGPQYVYPEPDTPIIETIEQEPDDLFEVSEEAEASGGQR